MAGEEHPLRIDHVRQKARLAEAPPVSGPRNRSKDTSLCSMPPAKRSSSEAGSAEVSSGGTKAAMAIGRNALSAKVESHHVHQRATVRRSIPGTADRRCRRAALAPWRIAEINVTIVAR